MAPKRRTPSTRTPSQGAQRTLSFQNTKSKITKPSTPEQKKATQKSSTLLEDLATKNPSTTPEISEINTPTTKADPEPEARQDEDDDTAAAARRVSDTQIARYWRAKENARLAPRVHQEDLGVHEKVLREWDTSSEYGPCVGITRLKRWKRASGLGLEPPIEVLAVLLRELERGEGQAQRAYVDELMGTRFVETT